MERPWSDWLWYAAIGAVGLAIVKPLWSSRRYTPMTEDQNRRSREASERADLAYEASKAAALLKMIQRKGK